ncbi:MAG: valine--tRNA ligase [Actinobacteria bacterium]|nr:valine--tRNA ligase [Actinomycetota bacterium]
MSERRAGTAAATDLPTSYDPAEVEGRVYAWWEENGFFHAEPDDPGEPFCIMLPLPNVTGGLHLGHALNHSIPDALMRRQRMRGANAMWQPGTDHAGIQTQIVVERQLAEEGLSRHDLGREAFVERVWRWREESGGLILRQMRRLGASCDWPRAVFTLDEAYVRAVREVFCAWYEQGLIYRGHRIINWCPRCGTALSDIEVDHVEHDGELAYLRYPAWDGGGGVVVATTRAETMLGDTAVAVHPEDERYRHLVGTTLRLPLLDRQMPVVADEAVDPSFGTGAVKVTPAHDPNDYEISRRHGLPAVDVMTDEARINPHGGPYEGLDRFEARERVKRDLDAQGLLQRVEAREHPVGVCSRCGTVVEPRLSDQWFVAVGPLAERAIGAVRAGRTRFVPPRNTRGFLAWLENLHDWCISRQLWWGHRIPAWYDRDGNVHVLRADPTPEEAEAKGLVRDSDVLDTWFSSQLWPFVTLGWVGPGSDTPALRTWYPTTVMVTGYDINTFWVSRMLMSGLHFLDEVPFEVVVNTGLVRDEHGKKMSKSIGNVIDPLDLIERYGADALRFALLRAAVPGTDVPIAEEWVEGGRRFVNKLWNAARFVVLNLHGVTPADGLPDDRELRLEDRWILSRLEAARAAAEAGFGDYDLAAAARGLYHFVWDEYCDWYLELAKPRVTGPAGQDADAAAARRVLACVLDQVLRLLHPLMPFVTEETWRILNRPDGRTSVMRAAWPEPSPARRDERADAAMGALQEAVTELRRFRHEHRLNPSARMEVVAVATDGARGVLEAGVDGIRRLAGVGQWTFADSPPSDGPVGKVLSAGAELYIPLSGLVDLDEERRRLRRELERARAEVRRAERKLGNHGFTAKAPAAVVRSERDKLAGWRATADTLAAQLESLG